MFRRSIPATILWILAIALFAVRMGEAHLHLCIDGQEQQPVSVHVGDAPTHNGADDSEAGHNDRDLALSDAVFVKKTMELGDLTLASIFAFTLVLVLPILKSVAPAFPLSIAAFRPLFHIRPPLRGPPL